MFARRLKRTGGLSLLLLTAAGAYLGGQAPPAGKGGTGAGGQAAGRRPNSLISRPVPDAAAVERGQKVFVASCGFCHGSRATGGENGPDLVRSVVALRDEGGDQLGPVIRKGNPDKGMPPFPMTDQQISDIAAFLRSRQQAAINRNAYQIHNVVTGDAAKGRAYFNGTGKCANLWTGCIVALNPDTGKMAWYFQASPHDTHDWDSVETPVLIDGEFNGQPRKMLAQASRNGYYFLLDRTNGKNLVSAPFVPLNWSKGLDAKGQPIPDPAKEPKTDRTLVLPASGGATNWPPPSFNPETGLFYVNTASPYSIFYLTDTDPKPEGWAGRDVRLWSTSALKAIDYQTGKVRWSHEYPGRGSGMPGILTTAGKLLFTGDPTGNLIAYDPATGRILWHARLGATVSNGPMTYELDGYQYLVVGAGDTLFAFTLLI